MEEHAATTTAATTTAADAATTATTIATAAVPNTLNTPSLPSMISNGDWILLKLPSDNFKLAHVSADGYVNLSTNEHTNRINKT